MGRRLLITAALTFNLLSSSYAAESGPVEVVRETVDRVLEEMATNGDRYRDDDVALYKMVRALVVPHFDLERTAQWVLARNWRGATPEQQQQFVDEFSTLMLRTYALGLRSYDNEVIEYLPLIMKPGSTRAIVKSGITSNGGVKTSIDYRLVQRDDGWKVYDVVIANISMVITYRSEYAGIIQSKGLDALIEMMAERNRELLKE